MRCQQPTTTSQLQQRDGQDVETDAALCLSGVVPMFLARANAFSALATIAAVGALAAFATAQEAAPSAAPLAVCAAADSGECSACHECCFAMDAETCAACVADACPANQCAPSSECNVCDACCKAFLSTQANCDSCVAAECGAPPPPPGPPPSPPPPSSPPAAPPPAAAAPAPAPAPGGQCFGEDMYSCAECAEHCWQPWAQCLRACPNDDDVAMIFLLIAVILPYAGRVGGEIVLGRLFGAFGDGRSGGEWSQLNVDEQHAKSRHFVKVSREEVTRVNIAADGLEWQYEVQVKDGRDCVMSVEFEEGRSSYRQRQASEVLQREQRVERVHGQYTPEVAGALVFRFDNSFSWINDKEITLVVTPHGVPRRQRGVTMTYACSKGSNWHEARQIAGLEQGGAVLRTLGRLLFWHVLQPLSYFAAFHTTAYQLDWLQYLLGAVVGVREGVYLLATFAALVKNPTFLLLQVEACARDRDASGDGSGTMIMNGGPSFLLMYALQPERVVERALFSDGGVGKEVAGLSITAGVILDLIGVAALGYGLSQGNLPPVLGVSYACTSAGGLAMLVALVAGDARDDLRRTTSSSSPRSPGSPRSPRGGLGGGNEVMVYSKSAGQWCKAQTPLLSSDSARTEADCCAACRPGPRGGDEPSGPGRQEPDRDAEGQVQLPGPPRRAQGHGEGDGERERAPPTNGRKRARASINHAWARLSGHRRAR